MRNIRLAILREGKVPPEERTPLTPRQAAQILQEYNHVEVICQPSPDRCFTDQEYKNAGIPVEEDVSTCDILIGIKEVVVDTLIEGKTYLFFSHTLKKQAHNQILLKTILERNITLIDYEMLRTTDGVRVIGFGRHAGLVGAYNCLWTYGIRSKRYQLRRAYECFDLADLLTELKKVDLPPLKIVLTGTGRVGKGAVEILEAAGIRRVAVEEFLTLRPDGPVYVQLTSGDYHVHKDSRPFDREEFHNHPERYKSNFLPFAHQADLLIAGAYWNPAAPRLFTREDMQQPGFSIKVIADISCDIDGSIPATVRATDIDNPVYDYDPTTHKAVAPFSDERNITVMAVDNLPCELPRSASEDFGNDLLERIMPSLLGDDVDGIIERATITREGELTEEFRYLHDWATGA
ncbi:MAG TPA: NAD(P)-dependent oxidoreductase [Cyclobacteriaceae bacterium]|nr:NAD(P)-dependent oxidoreductase [Cyclobacteriaceae bacterium]